MVHIPVMLEESLSFFREKRIETFFDGTVGGGGFAGAFLLEHPEVVTYFGCDRDPEAITLANKTLWKWRDCVDLIHGDFRFLDEHLKTRGVKSVHGFFLIWEYHRCN